MQEIEQYPYTTNLVKRVHFHHYWNNCHLWRSYTLKGLMHKLSGYCYILIKLYISVASITNDIFIRKLGHYMNSVNRSHVVYKPSTTNTQTYALQKLVFRASLCICLNTATADPKLVEVGTIGTKLTKRGEYKYNIISRLQSTDIIIKEV